MRIWLKKYQNEIADDFIYAAYQGFKGLRPICFFEEIEQVEYTIGDVVVSSVQDTTYIMNKIKVQLPYFYIPEELKPFAGRTVCKTTIKEAKERQSNKEKFFIKPVITKQFPSQIVDSCFPLMTYCDQTLSNNWECWISKIINFVSEYRIFLIQGEIVGCQYYLGDFSKFLNWDVVSQAIKTLTEQPIGWCLDFGIDENGKTLLIEANDGYSIGHYGLWPPVYIKLLEKRWKQLEDLREH